MENPFMGVCTELGSHNEYTHEENGSIHDLAITAKAYTHIIVCKNITQIYHTYVYIYIIYTYGG